MACTILDEIIEQRKKTIEKKGFSFGHLIPEKRQRPVFPFLAKKGLIFEIKKASPSKGWIAKDLDVENRALLYSQAGVSAISVLTEEDFFHGSIEDLMAVVKVLKNKKIAILRKDFLTETQDIDISYRIGADAVLLIASVLDFEKSKLMIEKTLSYEMSVLYEVRSKEEFEQYQALASFFSKIRNNFFEKVILGVNARDLKTFHIDSLLPVHYLSQLEKRVKLVYESGVDTKEMVEKLSSLGFYGLLIGESIVREIHKAKDFVKLFKKAKLRKSFWIDYVSLLEENKIVKKICGFTKLEDLVFASNLGLEMIGLIFSNKSKRNSDPKVVKNFSRTLGKEKKTPIRVGVITDLFSKESKLAQRLVKKGVLDVLQLHDFLAFHQNEKEIQKILKKMRRKEIPYYCALSLSSEKDIGLYNQLKKFGEFRILLDAPKTSEKMISKELLEKIEGPLWLAGGISPENVYDFLESFTVELLDFARATETKVIGVKDFLKIKQVLEIQNKGRTINA